MALVLADRVKVRSRTVGTGTFTLENTVAGFQSFSVIGDGNETFYAIVDAAGNWEIGRGTYTETGAILSRDMILSSSNSNSVVNFPVGSKNVYTTIPAALVGPILGTQSIVAIDIKGSVFADDSTMIIDGTEGNILYTPSSPADWSAPAPTTVQAALDRLATVVKALNGGTGA